MFRAKALTCCMLLSLLLVTGCSEDDEEDPGGPSGGHPPAEMVGSWTFQSVTVDGAAADLGTVLEWRPTTVGSRFHVQTNSAYVYDEVNAGGGQVWWESGFVFVEGNEMDINTLEDDEGPVNETTRVVFTLDSGVMTIQENDGGTIVEFTLGVVE